MPSDSAITFYYGKDLSICYIAVIMHAWWSMYVVFQNDGQTETVQFHQKNYREYGVLVNHKDAQHAESDWLSI